MRNAKGTDTNGVQCPGCGGAMIGTTDSRPTVAMGIFTIRRRRACKACGIRHTTVEMPVETIQKWRSELAAELVVKMLAGAKP
jgi:transcriptional regulator NrdR family protein